jgi:hypothetical protein
MDYSSTTVDWLSRDGRQNQSWFSLLLRENRSGHDVSTEWAAELEVRHVSKAWIASYDAKHKDAGQEIALCQSASSCL